VTQSVELLLDDDLTSAVRAEWQLLMEAGLPSQARHAGASNAPHVTLAVASHLTTEADEALDHLAYGAGSTIRLGGHLVFAGRTSVLARVVVPTSALLTTHRRVQDVVGRLPGASATAAIDGWTPHVTLARRLDADQLGRALALLADTPRELLGTIAGGRRWDSDERQTWSVGTDS
jgi:2'-5' RNA ligase